MAEGRMTATVERQMAARLRAQLGVLGPRHQGMRIPTRLRAEIIAHARAWRGPGGAVRAAPGARGGGPGAGSRAWGWPPESIRRWTHPTPTAAPALVPVQIVAERPTAGATPLTLVSPRGFRVEGLRLGDGGALL